MIACLDTNHTNNDHSKKGLEPKPSLFDISKIRKTVTNNQEDAINEQQEQDKNSKSNTIKTILGFTLNINHILYYCLGIVKRFRFKRTKQTILFLR